MAADTITSGAAAGRLAARAIPGGATAAEVAPLLARLRRDAVRLAKAARRRRRAWERRQLDFVTGLADGTIDADVFSAAELPALTTADRPEDVARLIAGRDAWEAAQAARWEDEQLGEPEDAEWAIFAA